MNAGRDLDVSTCSSPPLVNGHAKESPTEYKLTGNERSALQALSAQVANAKMAVYNLNVQLESALKEVRAAEERWSGALQLLAHANGMESAQLDPLLTKLTRA